MKDIPVEVQKGTADVLARIAHLDACARSAVLATVDPSGAPYVSLVTFAYLPETAAMAFATPRKSAKYRNMLAEPRVSLMIDSRPEKQGKAALMKAEAVTVMGTARALRNGRKRDEAVKRLAFKSPELAEFAGAGTTAIVLVEIEKAVHVSGFQSVTVWERS